MALVGLDSLVPAAHFFLRATGASDWCVVLDPRIVPWVKRGPVRLFHVQELRGLAFVSSATAAGSVYAECGNEEVMDPISHPSILVAAIVHVLLTLLLIRNCNGLLVRVNDAGIHPSVEIQGIIITRSIRRTESCPSLQGLPLPTPPLLPPTIS